VSEDNGKAPRPVDVRRRQKKIVDELIDLPREHEALEYAMVAFGASFDLAVLKEALRPNAEIELYSKVQALERAVTRVQNILADLAIAGAPAQGAEDAEPDRARLRQGHGRPAARSGRRGARSESGVPEAFPRLDRASALATGRRLGDPEVRRLSSADEGRF
jgi:hypothetical protein